MNALPDSMQCPDVKRSVTEEQAQRETVLGEEERKAAEEEAKQDAAEAIRQKQLKARITKERAEEEARAAGERRRVRAACALIYQNIADKKLNDLTVKEEQHVRTCQALGLYPPQ